MADYMKEWRLIRNHLKEIALLTRDGYNYRQISEYFGIKYSVFACLASREKALKEALQIGIEAKTQELQGVLYRAAMGIVDIDETVEVFHEERDENGNKVIIKNTERRKATGRGKPSVAAAIHLLKAYDPEHFERQNLDKVYDNGEDNNVTIVDSISSEDETKITGFFYDDRIT